MNIFPESCEIRDRLVRILSDRLGRNIDISEDQAFDREFLGSYWKLEPRDLLYVFFDVETQFGITIPQEDILSGKFTTVNNIVKIIEKQQACNCEQTG